MQLSIFNGSPRFKNSNSKILIDHFLTGMGASYPESIEVQYLAEIKKTPQHVEAFEKADTIIMVMPLYTDSMPGIVKHFIERIAVKKYGFEKRIGFIVQSGFPESNHSLNLERYLKKMANRMECNYIGTVIKGGVEGIQIMPPFMTVKLYAYFQELGKEFVMTGKFNELIVRKLRKPIQLSWLSRCFFQIGSITGLANFYWNSNLKKNGAYARRFAKPYGN